MPELTQQDTPPPDPPAPPLPGLDAPADDDPPAAVPPIIDPRHFEDFPVFRETFLVFFTDSTANATARSFGKLLHELILEFWGYWPDHPEGIFRASLRAAIADLRHVQASLGEWSGPDTALATAHEENLARLAGDMARSLGALADGLERELGSWRG